MTTLSNIQSAPSIYAFVTYERTAGENTAIIKQVFEINHGDLNQGLIEVDALMYETFNYFEGVSYTDRDMCSGIKEPLKAFWISEDEAMKFVNAVEISKDHYEVLKQYL